MLVGVIGIGLPLILKTSFRQVLLVVFRRTDGIYFEITAFHKLKSRSVPMLTLLFGFINLFQKHFLDGTRQVNASSYLVVVCDLH